MAEPVAMQDEADAPPPGRHEGERTRPVANASYLAGANLLGKTFSFVFVFYATRALGSSLWGNYTDVLALVGLFGVFTDLGLGTLAVRDVSQDQRLAERYISNLLAVRTGLAIVCIGVIIGLAQAPGVVAPSLRLSVYVYALSLVPLAVSNTLQLVFQFREQLAYGAVLNVVTAAAIAGLSSMALYTGRHVLGLVVVFTAVTTLSTGVMAWLVYTRFLPPRLALEPAWWPVLVRRALPFVLLTLLNTLYYRADTQILYVMSGCGHLHGNSGCRPVGLYGVAYRALDILVLVFVGSVNMATLPAFNRVVAESREALQRLIISSGTLMLAFGVPVALLASQYAPEAIYVLAGRHNHYPEAAPALAVLVWAFPCFMVLGTLYNGLYALHQQRWVTVAFGITLVFNVGLNLWLIPRYSFMACAALTVASEVLNVVIVSVALRASVRLGGLAPAAAKMAAIALVTGLALWALRRVGIFGPFAVLVGLPGGALMILAGLRVTHVLGNTEREILALMPVLGRFAGLV